MNSKTTLPITEARKRIFEIVEHIQKSSQHYTLTDRGVPSVVMMPFEEFEAWVETMDIMSDPKLMQEIKAAQEEFNRGDYTLFRSVYPQKNTQKSNAHVHNRTQKKRAKKS